MRLVFAPEQQIALFGGDPDNFTYPRYDLDMALFRVYQNGKPVDSKDYLKWNRQGAANNELVFVAGRPGTTHRLNTMAQLEALRDLGQPNSIKSLKDRIAVLEQDSALGGDQARHAASAIFSLANSLKANEGRYRSLLNTVVMTAKRKDEEEFRARIMAYPEWNAAYGGAWSAIADTENRSAQRARERLYEGLDSQFATLATSIVQFVAESGKPDAERLPGYHDAQIDSLKFRIFRPRRSIRRWTPRALLAHWSNRWPSLVRKIHSCRSFSTGVPQRKRQPR